MYVYLTCFLLLAGCRQEIHDYSEYLKWINDEAHGLVKEKRINNLVLTVKYLPADYLVYRDLHEHQATSGKLKDSLSAQYRASKCFLLTIAPDKEKPGNDGDIMMRGIQSLEQYKTRSLTMNFDMNEYLQLVTGKKAYVPVLTHMENVYGVTSGRTIVMLFSPDKLANELKEEEELDIVFDDPLFDTGRSHFVFYKKDIDRIPKFTF